MNRQPLFILERETTIVVRGNAHALLRDGGFRGLYVGTVRGWILDRKRLPDLCAYLTSRRVPFEVTPSPELCNALQGCSPTMVESPRSTSRPHPDRDGHLPERDLFDEVIS